ncbi:MAG: dTMP kinase [Acidobacteria bacterium RIFCSPLOWO2_02_FULL_68_18]|nr:MAG: dTMP kinase [Acidobacteria bacterium RIFCSPLOWO2_02_FULL_68_18]OFW50988.1 MAG: dTMP kinase [Acidobacteria bacterium RIFCSPLOWO2_12_FULL_68_19]
MQGLLIAFEGLDQSGKQTQAALLLDRLAALGRTVRLLSFPDYDTAIGAEIGRALRGERHYTPDVMQLLYVANRYEWKGEIAAACAAGTIVVCDRYLASSVAYGEAQGLDPRWLTTVQQYLPQPDVTILLDISPDVSAGRKRHNRDRYEQDLSLLERVRDSYLRQAADGWIRVEAGRDRDAVAADVWAAVSSLRLR